MVPVERTEQAPRRPLCRRKVVAENRGGREIVDRDRDLADRDALALPRTGRRQRQEERKHARKADAS
jgi:hypothetical protein